MGRLSKYATDEERKQAKRERMKHWYQANKERILEQKKQYYQVNKEHKSEYDKRYYQANAENIKEYQKQYQQANADKIAEQKKLYIKTPMGRACSLVKGYRGMDRIRGFGNVIDFDAKWIVENIFSKPCIYCRETDWHKLGCDRIDNSKPHTKDNVVPCCMKCNLERQKMSFEEFLQKKREQLN